MVVNSRDSATHPQALRRVADQASMVDYSLARSLVVVLLLAALALGMLSLATQRRLHQRDGAAIATSAAATPGSSAAARHAYRLSLSR
jgi:hypothetical protein